jgi:hypothetical protein
MSCPDCGSRDLKELGNKWWRCRRCGKKRMLAFRIESFVELMMSEEDQRKMQSWGTNAWASSKTQVSLGEKFVIVFNTKGREFKDESVVILRIPDEDYEKIASWGEEAWLESVEPLLGSDRVVILNRELAIKN